MTAFANCRVDIVSQGGGVVGVLVSAAATQATATETPCRECFVIVAASIATSAVCHFAINTSLTVSLGATLPKSMPMLSIAQPAPLRIPIDDVSKLWFYATKTDTKVGITYRT